MKQTSDEHELKPCPKPPDSLENGIGYFCTEHKQNQDSMKKLCLREGINDVVRESTLANQENNPKSRVSLSMIMQNGCGTEDNVPMETETNAEGSFDIEVDYMALG